MIVCWTDGAGKSHIDVEGIDYKVGVMGCGVVVKDDGKLLFESSFPLPYLTTSNVAEWSAFIACLKYLKGEGISDQLVTVMLDSKLVVNQFNGVWRVKKPHLKPYAKKAAYLSKGLKLAVVWVSRKKNTEADYLSKIGREKFFQD